MVFSNTTTPMTQFREIKINPSLREVSQDEFFATVGKLNVHPTPEGRYGEPDYRSDWKLLNGSRRLIGQSFDSCRHDGTEARYFRVDDWNTAN
jgi:hypothetical protein